MAVRRWSSEGGGGGGSNQGEEEKINLYFVLVGSAASTFRFWRGIRGWGRGTGSIDVRPMSVHASYTAKSSTSSPGSSTNFWGRDLVEDFPPDQGHPQSHLVDFHI